MKSKHRPLSVDDIYEDLLENLINLSYSPGDILRSDELQIKYNVLPERINEVLVCLSRDGFVELTKDGASVTTWEADDIEEIQELSLVLDRLVLEDIFEMEDRSVLLKELGIIRDRFLKSNTPVDHARWAEQFSKTLYRSSGSSRLLHMASSIKAQQAMLRNYLLQQEEVAPQLEEHEQIVAGIEQNNYDLTIQALETAYERKTRAILALI